MTAVVSIIMGIYNCSDTLGEAIESIFDQTYVNWELVMCDDGSSDSTYDVACEYQRKCPGKVKLIKNSTNMGLNQTLNRCLEITEGQYIARQDGDDVSMPERLELEVQMLESNPGLSFVSTAMSHFDDKSEWGRTKPIAFPQKQHLMQSGVFAHAACVMRKEALLSVGGYSTSNRLLRVEDYHLWYKFYKAGHRGANIIKVLYKCRDDRRAFGRRKFKYRFNEAYVKWLIFRDLKPGSHYLPSVVRPIFVGMLPRSVYTFLHRGMLKPEKTFRD